jgi:hypothetical protein
MKSQIYAVACNFLYRKIGVAKLSMPKLYSIPERVKKVDDLTIMKHGIFTGMALEKIGKKLCEGLEISIYLVWLRHESTLPCAPYTSPPESVKKPLSGLVCSLVRIAPAFATPALALPATRPPPLCSPCGLARLAGSLCLLPPLK